MVNNQFMTLPILSISLFGSFAATLGERPLTTFGNIKAKALLIYLLIEGNKQHAREALMTLLWPDAPLKSAQVNFRQVLARIRKTIPESGGQPLLLSDRKTVSLNPEASYEVDVLTFERLVGNQPSLTQQSTVDQMEEAAVLYRGDFLADFYLPDSNEFEQWVAAKRPYYRQQALATLDSLASHFLAQQDYAQAQTYSWQQLEIDPLRERACQQLMTALAHTGQRSSALAEYERFRQLLWDELEVEPSQETAVLHQQIQDDEIRAVEPPKVSKKTNLTPRNNIPTQPTPFIGREEELAALQAYLDDDGQRLITIVGPGGMGKTRLALAVTEQNLASGNSFANGIFFVNLAPMSEPSQMVSAIADAVNFQLAGGSQDPRSPKQQILDYLRKKHLLLLMDNFEHLLDGVDLLNEILDVAPGVQILATSRERLHLHQEQVYPIQGLEFPDWETPEDAVRYTAVQLFLQSAQRNQADFALSDGDDLTYLARICRLVAGMPLAIELAAAWVDTLPLADIATEIQESLDFLETEMRDMPERHRSIRASINYSWQKLDKKERDVFAACSVFRGGFTQKAGHAITGASLRTFSRLVNKSFLQFDSSTKRYQVHELMRQFGAEILAEDDERETAVRDQHSNYYLEALANRTEDLKGPRAKEAHQEITADYLNAYRAWHWSVQRHHFEPLDRAFFSLGYHAIKNDRNPEFEAALRSAIATMENSALTITQQLFLARLWIRLSTFVRSSEERQGALANGQALLDDLAESELDLRPVAAEFVTRSANLAVAEGRFDDALQLGKDGLILYQELNDQWHQANKLHGLGATSNVLGQQKVAESYFQQSLSLSKSIGDELGIIDNLLMLTEVSLNQGNAKHHREMVMEHLETAREFGNHQLEVSILATIGNTFLYEARPEETLKYYLESLEICEDVGYVWGILWVNISIADAHMRLDKMEEAEPYIHKGWQLAEAYESHELINQFLYLRTVLNLDKGHYDIALEEAQMAYSNAQKQGNAIMQARVAIWLAWLYVIKGNYEEAEPLIFISLSKRVPDSKGALELTAYLLVRRDPLPESLNYAWQLIALYEEFTIFHTFLPIQKVAKQTVPAVLSAMPPAEIEAAKAKGRKLEWESVIDDLLKKLPKQGWHVAAEAVPQVQEKDEAAATKLPEPAQLNERFVTERLFATGGHGQVYLGRDTTSGQQVIIKKLKPELAIQQPEYIARFIQEGEALRQLNHPNIVKMLATIENENEHLIVMEYVAGGSLRDLLEETPQLSLAQALNIGLELADALSRAHHLNIIHRDLKPSNVLLAEDGTPRLTDFGIAFLTNQETRITKDNAMLGTIRYMSPETCEGEVLDGRSDIWSFGVILYEMLAGQRPFSGETTIATLIAILNDPAPLLAELRPDIPMAFVTLIERMLVKKREGRIKSVRKVAAELESIQNRLL